MKLTENQQKWVDALRSGEFQQARKVLRRGDSYCCLGVACELYRQEIGGEWEIDGYSVRFFKAPDGSAESAVLPEAVRLWLGLQTPKGAYRKPQHESWSTTPNLAAHNDAGCSFEQIADIIEENIDTMSINF